MRKRSPPAPVFALAPGPTPVQRPAAAWPADRPPPGLRAPTRRLVGRIACTNPDADLIHQWPGTLITMVEVVTATLRQVQGAAPAPAAQAIVAALAAYIGGDKVCFPGPATVQRVLRDHQIYSAFNGRNTKDLAARFGLPVRTVQYILTAQRRLEQARRRRAAESRRGALREHS